MCLVLAQLSLVQSWNCANCWLICIKLFKCMYAKLLNTKLGPSLLSTSSSVFRMVWHKNTKEGEKKDAEAYIENEKVINWIITLTSLIYFDFVLCRLYKYKLMKNQYIPFLINIRRLLMSWYWLGIFIAAGLESLQDNPDLEEDYCRALLCRLRFRKVLTLISCSILLKNGRLNFLIVVN